MPSIFLGILPCATLLILRILKKFIIASWKKIYLDHTPRLLVIVPSFLTKVISKFEKLSIASSFQILHTQATYITEPTKSPKSIRTPPWDHSVAFLVSGTPPRFTPKGFHTADRTTPATYKQALNGTDSARWRLAMNDELEAMEANDVWVVVDRPPHQKILGSKYIYKIKENTDGSVNKYKARLVAQGFSQVEGVDFDESFAPVIKHIALRTCLALANQLDMELHQMDVNNAFLYGDIDEDAYMELPPDQRTDGSKV